MYVLNEVGTLVWERLDGRTVLPALVDAVCQGYDVSPEEAACDVTAFLGAMTCAGLITLVADTEG
jgi:hypothetical protein